MSNVITAERQKLRGECFCCKCGYRMLEDDEVMEAVTKLEVGVLRHVISVFWCLGCWSNYETNAFPKTPRDELNESTFAAWGSPQDKDDED